MNGIESRVLSSLFTLFIAYLFFSPCEAHTPSAASRGNKFLVARAVMNLHEECSESSPFVSQAIYGHGVRVVEEAGEGWAAVETEDGYVGYGRLEELVADNPRWRTSCRLARVASLCGLVYPIADTERPALLRLPYGARVELLIPYDENSDRWLEVKLVDGRVAWMQRGDLEMAERRSLDEMINLSTKFLERPYIWGGSSSEGFDCSGFVQTLYKEMGVLLPRDSHAQAASEKLFAVDFPEKAGDLLFFGDERITHVAIYLGDGSFIHADAKHSKPKTVVSQLAEFPQKLLAVRRVKEPQFRATVAPISDEVRKRMVHSWRDDNPVALDDLRHIALNHWGYDGSLHDGELIVHREVAEELVDIFEELFLAQYPIEKMLLIDAYDADDDRSCADNNSSVFCSRPVTGHTSGWSMHSYGLAIDINPLLNPYYNRAFRSVGVIGEEFLDRTLDCRGLIDEEDLCYKAFTSRGWKWGGHWQRERGCVDYQHFYKKIAL